MRLLRISLALWVGAQVLFTAHLQFPRGQNFDEFHYVPSAKQILAGQKNQNAEHPPLGKELLALGIAVGGDNPWGWRIMSTVFGSFTVVACFWLGFFLFSTEAAALWCALLTLVNQLLYVQSRIGMLDTFMTAFLLAALAALASSWRRERPPARVRSDWLWMGVFLGLSAACKWFGLIPWAGIIGLVALIALLRGWQMQFSPAHPERDWYRPDLFKAISPAFALLALVIVPALVYSLTFVPLAISEGTSLWPWELWQRQYAMYDAQLRVVSAHPYMSSWYQWPLLTRPIWYAFDKEGPGEQFVRGVLLLGNPLVMWTGLAAVAFCVWDLLKNRSQRSFFVVYFYAVFYLSWLLIPRKVSFYYYYYPAGMMLTFALAQAFDRLPLLRAPRAKWIYLGAAAGLFVYFLPILSGMQIHVESFRRWMWFTSWI